MIELGKKYRTRDGREVRIYAVDGGGQHPVRGAIKSEGIWHVYAWRFNGEYTTSDCADLIEVQAERWHPIILSGDAFLSVAQLSHPTRDAALKYADGNGCKSIDAWLDPRSGK